LVAIDYGRDPLCSVEDKGNGPLAKSLVVRLNSVSAIAQTVSGAADKVSSVVSQAAETAEGVAREAGRRASAMAESAYGQGGDLIDVIEGAIRGNPIGSVLAAAAIGYGIAHLSLRR
jgi:hypothetical protein